MTRCCWRRQPQPVHAEDKWQSHHTALISQPRPQASACSTPQAGGDEEEDDSFLSSHEERPNMVCRQRAGEKGDGASPRSPEGNGN